MSFSDYGLGRPERYSLSDKQVYGAEDDDEMDAILDAIGRALEGERWDERSDG